MPDPTTPTAGPWDLLIQGGMLLDPANGIHAPRDIAVRHGRVAGVGAYPADTSALEVVDASGLLVVPGLVDLHVHVAWGSADLAIEPGPHDLRRGVTTMVDGGTTGAHTFDGFRRTVIEPFPGTILAFLNIAVMGQADAQLGELHDLRYAQIDRVIETVRAHPDRIVGIKVRVSEQLAGANGVEAVRMARAAASVVSRPLLVHVGGSPVPIDRILDLLAPGDIVTHTYTPWQPGVIDPVVGVASAARAARDRGVLFDVGHGAGSFSFLLAARALADDFPPDTISTDLHRFNVEGPVRDLPTTMTKLLHLGVPLEGVVRMSTSSPAEAIGRAAEHGSLGVGARADIALLRLEEGSFPLTDSTGRSVDATRRLLPVATFAAGRRVG